MKTTVYLLFVFSIQILAKRPKILTISENNPDLNLEDNFQTNSFDNFYEIQFLNENMISKTKYFYFILESENVNFQVKFFDSSSTDTKKRILSLENQTGNMVLIVSDTLFNGRLKSIRQNGNIRFQIFNSQKNENETQLLQYKIRMIITENLPLNFGKQYTVKLDRSKKSLSTDITYDGVVQSNLKRLRFQTTTIFSKSKYLLRSTLYYKKQTFNMNHIFKKTVGGILSLPDLPVCLERNCLYKMKLDYENVKVINIETFFISEIETLNINHYEGYYDKTYQENSQLFYKLPFTQEIEGLDISISLIPVNSQVSLYVNPQSKPTSLENYNWKEKGNLAKKITIKWQELMDMQLKQTDLFITVLAEKPGEFYLVLDAHEQGYKGLLQPGISEAGFVKYEDYNNYLYNFEVEQQQEIKFDVKLNIESGNADLYIQRCKNINDCQLDLKDPETLRNENDSNIKEIEHSFNCEGPKNKEIDEWNICQYLISVKGKENHGTHFDISVQEKQFHRLMTPGKLFDLNMIENQQSYFKFSYPNSHPNNSLYFQIENDYGEYEVYISRTSEFPSKLDNDYVYAINSNNAGLLNQFKEIDIQNSSLKKNGIPGHYYITVNASTTSELRLKFYERNLIQINEEKTQSISIHALTAGRSVRGEIKNSEEIIYYTIRVSLDNKNKKNVMVLLTSLKGDFIIFANRNGEFPDRKNHEYFSEDNFLKLPINQSNQEVQEYIIGVQKSTPINNSEEKFQFTISFSYSMNAIKLIPGILSTYFVQKQQLFFLEINSSMKNLLVVKSIVDGYNIDLCATFSGSQDVSDQEQCDSEANGRQHSLFYDEFELKEKCKTNIPCFLHLKIKNGVKSEKFQLGYVFNDKPFQLNKGQVLTGPAPKGKQTLRFIYHPEKNVPCNLYFNSKGRNLAIYSKISNLTDPNSVLEFPSESNTDYQNQKDTFIQNFYYSKEQLNSYGDNPEIIISVVNQDTDLAQNGFDNYQPFLIQLSGDSTELIRTHTLTQNLSENQWFYYHLYNNGSADELRIYLNSSQNTIIEAYVSKGLLSRPPFTSGHLIHKKGRDSIQLDLKLKNLKSQDKSSSNILLGNFVVAVKLDKKTDMTIFWNNKKELNYIELTPGEELNMAVQQKKNLYFNLFAKDVSSKNANDRGKIIFYFKTNAQLEIYLLKTDSQELITPSKKNYNWKTQTTKIGGLTAIEILPSDPNYCIDCQYIGKIMSQSDGKLSILSEIEHINEFLEIKIGSPLPCYLLPHEQKKFKIWNPDSDLMDFTVQMMSGYVDIFVSDSTDVSDQINKERHQLRQNLEVQKMFVIAPSVNYQIMNGHYYYLVFKNTADLNASMIINADKNDIASPILPGIRKMSRLAPGETSNYYYTPNPSDKLFEIQFELQSVFDEHFQKQALSLMKDYVNVYHMSENQERFLLKYKSKTIHKNRVYINFDISDNKSGTFTIHVYNPVGSGVTVAIDLLNGGYRILNLNQHTMDILKPQQNKVFEAHGEIDNFLYFDMKMCTGDVKVRFLEKDGQDIDLEESQAKTIKDNNTFLHYLKIKKKNLFIQIQNDSDKDTAMFDLMTYVQKNVSKDPSSEIIQENDGKVMFETDSSKIVFDSLKIKSNYEKNFIHKIIYTVYLSPNYKVMRYTKNCGEFMLDQTYPDEEIYVYDLSFDLQVDQLSNHFSKIAIDLLKLPPNTKFYGVLVADIQIFPKDIGMLTPIRSNKVFYDEFIFVTPRYNIPFIYFIQFIIAFGFIIMLFCLIKGYVFGKVNRLNKNQLYNLTSDVDESSLGYTIMKAMESDMIKELSETENQTEQQQEMDIEEKLRQEETFQEIEMTEEQTRSESLTQIK